MDKNRDLLRSAFTFALIAALSSFLLYSVFGLIGVVSATTSANTIGGNVAVPSTCIPEVSNKLIGFPSTPAGSFAPTSNAELVTNFGNAQSNILVDGSNLVYLSNTIWVSNILWSATSGANIGTQLTNSIAGTDTKIVTTANGGTNNIFFGSNAPSVSPGTYAGTVNVMLSC